jgi:hypothetical protein
MASRLQAEDANGQNNWADIEDDDDDWAPEAITWTDGTKIEIPHVEDHSTSPAPESPARVPAIVAKENKAAPAKPRSPAPGAQSSAKLGLAATSKSLVLKGAPEKPTLVAKPPAPPTPVKSPWASLPKVDRSAPVVMDIPQQQEGGRYVPGQGPSMQSGTPPPPKEIAADDFNRGPWRNDGAAYGSRELFNSQSGRYEPVTDRRASRPDASLRAQPAVLQRASQGDSQGPAEPSAAFQTHRSSGAEPPYGRRRGSSNVSGGSGFLARYGKGSEMPPPMAGPELVGGRRGSMTAGSDSAASHAISPSTQLGDGQQQSPWQQSRVSPMMQHSVPLQQVPPQQQPGPNDARFVPSAQQPQQNAAPGTEEYEYQRKLMRERRELAMKRRLEEEAQAEAERKERIRLKLEAMGPAPERRKAKKDGDAATSDGPSVTSSSTAQPNADSVNIAASLETRADSSTKESTAAQPNGVPSQASGRRILSGRDKGDENLQAADTAQPPQAWAANSGSWPTTAQKTTGNVWGPPSSDRSLGNGTFNSGLGSVSESAQTQLSQASGAGAGPGPIGPPKFNVPAGREAGHAGRQPPIGPPRSQSGVSPPELGRHAIANAWTSAIQKSDADAAAEVRAAREEAARKREAEGLTAADTQATITDKWRPVKLSDEGRRMEDSKRQVAVHATARPAWNVQQPDGAIASQQSSRLDGEASRTSEAQKTATAPDGALGSALSGNKAPAATATARSRFFPSRDVRNEPGYAEMVENARPGSPSPPPPDTIGHPAFDGDTARPHVALPRPQPVVRLPPAIVAANAAPSSFGWANPAPYRPADAPATGPPAGASAASGQQPLTAANWQARFDDLTGRSKAQGSMAKPTAVDAVTRGALEHGQQARQAGVSFPGGSIAALRKASDDDSLPTTRVMAEDCFGEQEMGSLPPVRIPKQVPDNAWQPAAAPLPNRFAHKFRVTVLTVEQWEIDHIHQGGAIRIKFPFMNAAKFIQARAGSNPRARGGRGGGGPRTPSQSHRGGFKGRDTSASFSDEQTPAPASSSGSSPSAGRGGRGRGYRARSENWSRHPTPLRT